MTNYYSTFNVGDTIHSRIQREYDTAQGNKARIIPGMPGTIVKRTAVNSGGEPGYKYKVKFDDAIDLSKKPSRGGTMVLNLNGLSHEEIERPMAAHPDAIRQQQIQQQQQQMPMHPDMRGQ